MRKGMKLGAKVLSVVMAGLTVTSMAACGGGGVDDSETNLVINFYSAGYGENGFKALETAFETKYPEYTVTLLADSGLINANVEATLTAGPKINPVDLYFCGDLNIWSLIEKGANVVQGYDCVFEDLTSLYNTTVDGQKYKDKMLPYFEEYHNYNGKYYSTSWATGINGLAYNAAYFEKEGWEIPVTTKELEELIVKMKGKGYVPFVWPGGVGYWSYVTQAWWAQYAGEEQIADFYQGIDMYGERSADCFYTPAFYETYRALEMCISDEANSYTGSISLDHLKSQNYFYLDSNKICMMPTGSWLETEMAENGTRNVRMMRAPILSSVLKNTNADGSTYDRFETVKDETTLRAVVKAIDRGESGYTGVSVDDFATIKKMRSYVTTTSNLLQAVVPSYANAKPIALKFLEFMATDEAMQLFYDACGTYSPFNAKNLDFSNATAFNKDVLEGTQDVTFLSLNFSKNKLFYATELDYQVFVPELYIGSQSEADKKDAMEFFEFNYGSIRDKWHIYLQLAGIE